MGYFFVNLYNKTKPQQIIAEPTVTTMYSKGKPKKWAPANNAIAKVPYAYSRFKPTVNPKRTEMSNAPAPMVSMPFAVIISLIAKAQLWVEEKAKTKNIPIPATNVPTKTAVILFAPTALNLTYPILGTVICFFKEIQIGTSKAGRMPGKINQVLSCKKLLSKIPEAKASMYIPMNMSISPSWW